MIQIPDFENYYITDDWKCYSTNRNRVIGCKDKKGHTHFYLSKCNTRRHVYLHVLIAEICNPIPEKYKDVPREEMVVHHKDFNAHNDNPLNLQWMTKSEHDELHKNSVITRKRKSESHKGLLAGEKNPMYGKHLSEETKRKIGKAQKGKVMSEESRRKMSKAKKGTPIPKLWKPVVQINITNGEIIAMYQSLEDASKITSVCQNNISSCCNNKRKTAGGYKWRYLN